MYILKVFQELEKLEPFKLVKKAINPTHIIIKIMSK